MTHLPLSRRTRAALHRAFAAGAAAHAAGVTREDCPFEIVAFARAWVLGWDRADRGALRPELVLGRR